MKRIFADAFFYIAVLNRHDAAHGRAMSLVTKGWIKAVTTTAVLLELADAMSAPAQRRVCAEFLEDLPAQGTIIHPLSEGMWRRGIFPLPQPRRQGMVADGLHFVHRDGG